MMMHPTRQPNAQKLIKRNDDAGMDAATVGQLNEARADVAEARTMHLIVEAVMRRTSSSRLVVEVVPRIVLAVVAAVAAAATRIRMMSPFTNCVKDDRLMSAIG